MNHRARNAFSTSRRTRPRACGGGAPTRTRPRTTCGKRTNQQDAPKRHKRQRPPNAQTLARKNTEKQHSSEHLPAKKNDQQHPARPAGKKKHRQQPGGEKTEKLWEVVPGTPPLQQKKQKHQKKKFFEKHETNGKTSTFSKKAATPTRVKTSFPNFGNQPLRSWVVLCSGPQLRRHCGRVRRDGTPFEAWTAASTFSRRNQGSGRAGIASARA